MKLTLTVAIFLGLTSAVRIQNHHRHYHNKHHHQRLAQGITDEDSTNAWVEDCDAARDVSAATNPSGAGTWEEANKGSYPGVGVECQGFAQKGRKSLAQRKSRDDNVIDGQSTNAWVGDCDPTRDVSALTSPSGAGTGGSYPGVGITCQGFAQKKKHSLAQQRSRDVIDEDSTNAWVSDCSPGRDLNDATYGSGTQGAPGALANGSFTSVGVECQGFAQKGRKSLAQQRSRDVIDEDSTNAWVSDCSVGRDLNDPVYGSGTQGAPGALPNGSFEKVGTECQGFAQKNRRSLAQQKDDAWIDDCDPARDVSAAKNPSGAGTWEEGQKGSYPGVGVECQGFAQKKKHSLAQQRSRDIIDEDSTNAWVSDCDPDRDVTALTAPHGAGTGASYPGVGIECQGFAQKGRKSLAQRKSRDVIDGSSTNAWVSDCDPARDVSALTSPSGAGTGGSYPGVGIECQGFAQKKKHSLAQQRSRDIIDEDSTNAWVSDCDPNRDVTALTAPSGAGTGGSYPGVGIECQGFAQVKSKHHKKNKLHHHLRKHARDCSDDMPDCNGTNGTPGVDCCDE